MFSGSYLLLDLGAYNYSFSRDAGAIDEEVIKSTLNNDTLDRIRNKLDGRTGDTDSEAEE